MNEAERKLVEALRSGRYKQTTGKLRRGDAFCCLGVACDLFDPTLWNLGGATGCDTYSGSHSITDLPTCVRSALGWRSPGGRLYLEDMEREGRTSYLIDLNDDGFTFEQIADVIEAGLVVKA